MPIAPLDQTSPSGVSLEALASGSPTSGREKPQRKEKGRPPKTLPVRENRRCPSGFIILWCLIYNIPKKARAKKAAIWALVTKLFGR
jgi:hypothetical protein